jgi:hypothetical protein
VLQLYLQAACVEVRRLVNSLGDHVVVVRHADVVCNLCRYILNGLVVALSLRVVQNFFALQSASLSVAIYFGRGRMMRLFGPTRVGVECLALQDFGIFLSRARILLLGCWFLARLHKSRFLSWGDAQLWTQHLRGIMVGSNVARVWIFIELGG